MVLRLLSPQFLVLWAVIGSTLAVHFRGKVRLGFWRQLSDHSTLMAPYNVLMYIFSVVPNRPILEEKSFPEMKVLGDNWQTIREEALQLFAQGKIKAADKYNDWGFNSFFRTGWKRFYLKWYDEPLPSAVANCPRTVALLSSIPNIKGAMFTNLPPGGKLVQHRDPYAGSIRYHLGLHVPTSPGECRIFIDGEALLFDETYLHYAENTTSDDRLILFCDIERPLTSGAMTAVNRWFSDYIIRESATQNVEGERVGWINRMFGYAYQVRLRGKRMKAWNKRAYYFVKYVPIGGILAAFLAPAFA